MKNRDFLYSGVDRKGHEVSIGFIRSVSVSPIVYSHGPLGPSAQGLLDLLVRTDTKGVGLGLKGSPTVPIRCEACGLPLKACKCIPGLDY